MDNEKLKHLEFIQNVVTRMNTNSFQIKGWAITIVAATLALYASTGNEYFILVGVFPSLIFWFLDAYYLMQERMFRGLYDDVADISVEGISKVQVQADIKLFSMDIEPYTYNKTKNKRYCYWCVWWSATTRNLYLPIIVMLIGIFFYLQFIMMTRCYLM